MALTAPYKVCFVPKSREEKEEDEKFYKRYREIVATLPKQEGWIGTPLYQYEGFWYDSKFVGGPLAVQDHFKPLPSDIIIASHPKCGSTWLRSLAFAIMNNKSHPPSDQKRHPLHLFNSHDLVPLIEEPKDTFASWWHYVNMVRPNFGLEPMKLEEVFEMFCKGILTCCPFWDHVLSYWKQGFGRPQNVLFLKYEELLDKPTLHLKSMAEFMDYPFSSLEEKEGVVDQIMKLCSFQNLSSMAVNKTATTYPGISNSVFFRKGKVGDSANCLTPEMMEQLNHITEQKLLGSRLTL